MEAFSNDNATTNNGKMTKKYYYYSNNKNNSNGNVTVGGNANFIKKGPWKAEEDQVLINHVNKYGPRDWSSIRSKGLLCRTGKSCRLRWVNKLRPNLKSGCKFTAEEERVVIELQAQIGNKWARIATHLSGRTDNDVKNFWSSRQKRLARILHSQSPPRPNKKHKSSASSSTFTSKDRAHFLQVTKKSSTEGETSSKAQSVNSSSNSSADKNNMEMIPFTGSVDHNYPCVEASNAIYLEPIPLNTYYNNTDLQLLEPPSFPTIPHLQTDLISFPPETQELIDRLDSGFFSPFGCTGEPALADDGISFYSCFDGDAMTGETRVKRENYNHATPDSFFDDFPSDVFDEIEPLPSPSGW